MAFINKHDTNGTKGLLAKGELGYDDYSAGGDTGRVYVGNGASNISLAKKSEVDAKVVANAGITAGTATKVTYDAKGLVISGTNPTTLGGYGITDTYTKTETNTQISTAVNGLVDAAPGTLDTLNELAAALGDDPNFATTVTNNIATKVTKNADITAGTNTKITYDTKGLVTGGSTPTTLAGYSIANAYTKTEVDSSLALKVEKVTSTDNAIVRFDGTTGAVQNSGVIIDDNGNLNITGTGKRITGDFSNATDSNKVLFQSNTVNGNTFISSIPNGTATTTAFGSFNSSDASNSSVGYLSTNSSTVRIISATTGTGVQLPIAFFTVNAERMRIDTSGNVLVTGSGALGYGAGSGGTVTQLTSKSTSVTLNKPTGEILMHNAALAAGASVIFIINNSLVGTYDTSIATARNGNYEVKTTVTVDGAIHVKVTNISGVSLSESVAINFTIIKGANT